MAGKIQDIQDCHPRGLELATPALDPLNPLVSLDPLVPLIPVVSLVSLVSVVPLDYVSGEVQV